MKQNLKFLMNQESYHSNKIPLFSKILRDSYDKTKIQNLLENLQKQRIKL